jgi:hypothetical protein
VSADAYYEKRRKAAVLAHPQDAESWPPWHELSPRERQQWRREALEAQGAFPQEATPPAPEVEGPHCEIDDGTLFPELEPHDP